MTKLRLIVSAISTLIIVLALSSIAAAQATRTWVSGVGDDVNPCSRTAPCKTFAGAISKTAAGGEIDCIDPGGFGAVTITKSMTIDGGGTFGSILAAGTTGIIINDSANPPTAIVTIRNISINGAGTGVNGIRILKAKTVHVENVEIFGFTGNGIDGQQTVGATGGSSIFLDDVDVRNLSGALSVGIQIKPASGTLSVFMDHVRVERIGTGVQVNINGNAFIRDSMFINCVAAIEMVNNATGAKATIEDTFLTKNTVGLSAGTGTTTFLSQSTITECATGISAAGGIVQSSGNNRILGNGNDGLTPTIVNPK